MPRFVVLQHEFPDDPRRGTHWDFMLEAGDTLWTWALPQSPEAGQAIDGTRLPDHRLHYLDYEGPIAGNRGTVRRWDTGTYDLEIQRADRLEIAVRGAHLSGRVRLEQSGDNPQSWRFSVEPAM